ncbi:MAG: M48 family metallopeptidase, partial [Spirochaetes bacterium]|nr:M48 family metallopeptidase [Spirochaetota bacterium]
AVSANTTDNAVVDSLAAVDSLSGRKRLPTLREQMRSIEQQQELILSDIGEIQLVKNNRAKRMSITLKPFHGVRVTVPFLVSFQLAEEFVKSKEKWIKRHLEKLKTKEQSIKGEYSQAQIEVLRKQAKEYLPKRTAELAKRHHFFYHKITIRNSKTRWGSCSSKKNLNFSLYLIQLPDYLIDYIILHELCHTKQMNHSKKFWDLMTQICPQAKKYNKEMKQYHPGYYL